MKKLLAVLLAAILVLGCASALAEWPERAIELIVPANPGGDTDANARALAAALNETMGWNVIVTNMNGGAGAVAFEDLTGNPDPGYRFVFYHSGSAITQLMGMYDFDLLADFQLAAMPYMDFSSAFLINANNPKFNDLPSMVEYMKAHPGEVSFATETGSFTHLHALAFEAAAGVKFNIVDAGTAAQKITELLGQRLDVIDTQAGLVRDYLDTEDMSQKFIALGVMSEEKLAGRPELLTFKEQGYDIVFPKFFYLAAPNAVEADVIAKLNDAITQVAANEGLQTYAANALVNVTNMTPDESEAFFAGQVESYKTYLADYIE